MLRAAPLALVLLVGACATDPFSGADPLPAVRYAAVASHLDLGSGGSVRPSPQAFDASVQSWTEAIGDAAAGRLAAGEVTTVGMVAAVELASMAAFVRTGGHDADLREMGRYAADMALAAAAEDRRPSRSRCSRLNRWLPEVNRQGGAAVRRATLNGLRRGLFGGS